MPKSLLPPIPRRLLSLLLCLLASASASEAARAQQQQPPPQQPPTHSESLPELVRRVKPSVVAIVTYDAKGEPLLSGSGFFIRPGQVLTNLHVVEGARRVEVKTLDGKGRIYASAGALDFDEEADLAVLSVEVPHERARVIELTNNLPEEGESVFVIGNPLRLEGSVSDGIVSAVREVPNLGKIIQTTAPISHGNSGSPVFNLRGQVIGVVTVKVTNGQNINLALASARLASLKPDRLTTFDALATRNRSTPGGDASAEWWYKNGLNSLWLGNYDGALGSFEQVVNKNPNRVEAWIQVGFCKVKQGKMSDAIRAYKQALRLRPNSVEAYNKLGDAYYYAANFNEAINAYTQAARLRPDLGEAFYNLGMTYLEIGDRNAAHTQSRLLQTLDAELYQKLVSELRR
jgi:S1-C subfamily serine protease